MLSNREARESLLWQEYSQRGPISKIKKLLNALCCALFESNGLMAYIPIAFVTIAMFCGASWLIFWTATDPAHYQCYALTFWLGSNATKLLPASQCTFLTFSSPQPPFHMLPIEYPPLTLLPFSLPLLMPSAYYQWAFALLMSLVSLLSYWLLLRYGPRGSAFVFAFYLFIGALVIAQARFDLIPATLTLMCLMAAERKHWSAAYIALAFGVLMKIYPLLLLPVLFIAEQQANKSLLPPDHYQLHQPLRQQFFMLLQQARRWHWKNCLLFLGVIVGISAIFALLNFNAAVISQFRYFMNRPIQIESIDNTLLWLTSHAGFPLQFIYNFGSINSLSPLSGIVSRLTSACFALGCIYIFWQQWHGQLDLTQTTIALLLLFIATSKVFSLQYLIWLIPLLAYAGAFDTFWILIWGTISVLTSTIFIFFYSRINTTDAVVLQSLIASLHGFFEIIGIRNALFVFLTLAYLFNWFQVRQRKPLSSPPKQMLLPPKI
jgi:hypothetical protein